MKPHGTLILVALAIIVAGDGPAHGEPARFWLSTLSSPPSAPESPTLTSLVGQTREVHIWGRPGTLSGGPFHPVQNPFKTLQNVALNLVADSAAINLVDSSITVHNPQLDSATRRFEFTHDAANGLTSASCATAADGICGLQGFSITPSGAYLGLGPECHPNDPFCATASDGGPAWRLASVEFEALQLGQVNLHLQIGANGINHTGEGSLNTDVLFGAGTQPIYHAGLDTDADGLVDMFDRDVTLPGDSPDLIVHVVQSLPMLIGDYNASGTVEQADLDLVLLNWGDQLPNPAALGWTNDLPSGPIDQSELDKVLLNWGGGGAASTTIPEPCTMILLFAAGLGYIARSVVWHAHLCGTP